MLRHVARSVGSRSITAVLATLVAISEAGAYAASLASTYNGRPRAPQVMVEMDGRLRRTRRARSSAQPQD